jgi:hypothetical protein
MPSLASFNKISMGNILSSAANQRTAHEILYENQQNKYPISNSDLFLTNFHPTNHKKIKCFQATMIYHKGHLLQGRKTRGIIDVIKVSNNHIQSGSIDVIAVDSNPN